MKKSILYFLGLLLILSVPLILVGVNHLSRSIITPNDRFFELQIGEIPNIEKENWTLTITGAVENELVFDYENLTQMESVTEIATLECVDGPYGTAEWKGIPLYRILELAGLNTSAKDLIFYAADNYSDSLNLKEASAKNILLAYKMNGVDLPPTQGFPLRLVCPDHYGYKWVKWIVKIEVVDYNYIGFWESRGWSDNAMRTNFTSWITHAYLFSISFMFGGLAFISGYKSIPNTKRYPKLPKFMKKRFHLASTLTFVIFSIISFIYWSILTVITRGALFYSIHGILGLITIISLITATVLGFLKTVKAKEWHQKVSKIAWYMFVLSILIGFVISVFGTLRLNQIFISILSYSFFF
jgi:hypothetical protein